MTLPPRMISDDSLWPLGMFVAEGHQSLDLHNEMLAVWNAWLQRRQRFIALRIFLDEASLQHSEGVAKVTKAWLQDGAATAIRNQVAAMAIVVPWSSIDRMRKMSVEAAFGIPGGIFPDIDDALAWLSTGNFLSPDMTRAAMVMNVIHNARRVR